MAKYIGIESRSLQVKLLQQKLAHFWNKMIASVLSVLQCKNVFFTCVWQTTCSVWSSQNSISKQSIYSPPIEKKLNWLLASKNIIIGPRKQLIFIHFNFTIHLYLQIFPDISRALRNEVVVGRAGVENWSALLFWGNVKIAAQLNHHYCCTQRGFLSLIPRRRNMIALYSSE